MSKCDTAVSGIIKFSNFKFNCVFGRILCRPHVNQIYMNYLKFASTGILALLSLYIEAQNIIEIPSTPATDPVIVFNNPPESSKPGVLWMWMGSNISRQGITRDLETLKDAGFNRTTMFHLADITTSLPAEIGNRPGPEIISWTETWWELVRFAAEESKRLGMDFGMFNCPGYETSGGPWITPELSMQDICWSEQVVKGNSRVSLKLKQPDVNPRANHPFPSYNRETGQEEIPVVPARNTYYRDIAVLAVPSTGIITKNNVINLTDKMQPDGELSWDAPDGGEWAIYRFGHTTTGAVIFPAQWQVAGLECDKMNQEAVDFHIDHVISGIRKHLGDLIGTGFTHVHFDSYEAGIPTWTPKMQEEFLKRRGYDLTPYLVTFAGKKIGSKKDSVKFRNDFDATIRDLYRDVYFATISKKMDAAGLTFLSEPYGGPWRNDEVMPYVQNVMTEFFTDRGVFSPFEFEPTVAALRKAGKNLIETEAFTGRPAYSQWTETPAWLKPIGDAAYCAGSNRFIIHRFVHQPWDDRFKPGATMGQWGSHFDRTQTWWEPGKALVKYWQRCQALLQWGQITLKEDDFNFASSDTSLIIKYIHRSLGTTDIYFVANTNHSSGSAICRFNITGMMPELWDPVAGTMRNLPVFEDSGKKISIPIKFDDAQSFFIVFRNKTFGEDHAAKADFPLSQEILKIEGPWQVSFDHAWGGPAEPVTFVSLEDWTKRAEPGIKYYSGTATYRTEFDAPGINGNKSVVYLDLGVVKHIARVKINGQDLGVVWTAPWNLKLPLSLLIKKGNRLEIEITNVWANRLIGDEQEQPDAEWAPGYSGFKAGYWLKQFPEWFVKDQPRPSENRYCFTTWNYFTKDSLPVSSGLLGPVILTEENAIGMNEGSLTLSSPLDYQVFQRFARDRGTISIEGIVDGIAPDAIEVKIEGAGEKGEWSKIPATINGSAIHAVKTLSAGGWYRVEIRAVRGKKIIAGSAVEHVGVGEVFIVAGQSNSANYGEERQKTKTGMVSVFNGNGWQLANDPQPGAGGNSGSFIPPFGDAVSGQFRVPVGFIACGIGATSVREWLPAGTKFSIPPTLTGRVRQLPDGEWESDGQAFHMFISRMKQTGPHGFRAVLWHQGESDANQPEKSSLPGYLYWQYMELLIHSTRLESGWDVPWFVARATYHIPGDEASPDIRAAQKALWESGIALEGPDTDAIKGELRENKGKGVHFSGQGLRQHAASWVEKVAPWLETQISGSSYNKVMPLKGETFSVNGHEAFVILPENLSGHIPWVWYAPTLPGLPGMEEQWMFEKFTKAGIAVAGIDAGESFGSPDGKNLFTAFYTEMTEKRGFSSKPVMLGRSRGGLMTLSWAEENPDKTGGFAGIYPVCDITSYPGIEKASSAYHITPEELAEKLEEYNPVDQLKPLASADIPLFSIHGDSDVVVPLENNSGKMKKRYDTLGGRMQIIIPHGQGHNMWEGFFKNRKLVDFVIKNAKAK
jgi:hypothetical protein